jgi:hypothetical protein
MRLAMLLVIGTMALPTTLAAQTPAPPPPGWYPPPAAYPPYAPPPHVEEFDGFNVPAGYHVETRPRVGLIVGGAVPFGVLYMLSVSVAAKAKTSEGRWMAVPVIGPFAAMGAHQDPCATTRGTEGSWACVDFDPTLELFDGLGQIVGASLLTAGLLSRRSVLVPNAPYRAGAPSIWLVPSFSRASSRPALSIAGTF